MANFVREWSSFTSSSVPDRELVVDGATPNNLLVLVWGLYEEPANIVTDPAWTSLFVEGVNNGRYGAAWKIADGNANDNFLLSYDGLSGVNISAHEFTGTSTDSPLEVIQQNTEFLTVVTNSIPATLATSSSADGIFIAGNTGWRGSRWTPNNSSVDSGFTNYLPRGEGNLTCPTVGIASKPFSGGISAENPTFSTTDNPGDIAWAFILVAKEPSAGPVPAVLSDPTTTSITQTTATVGCTTDTAGGTMYWYVSTSPTPPSIADHKSGAGAVSAGNYVPILGANTASATGLTAGTTYYHHHLQNTVDGDSNQLTSPSFDTLPDAITASGVGNAQDATGTGNVDEILEEVTAGGTGNAQDATGSGTVTVAITATGVGNAQDATGAGNVDEIRPATVEVTLTDVLGNPLPNLTGLTAWWIEDPLPTALSTIADWVENETTDANGVFSWQPNTSLTAGQVGWLNVTDSTGAPVLTHRAFSGPVVVS